MHPKIDPYHYRPISQRFSLEEGVNMPDEWVSKMNTRVVDRMITHLKPRFGLKSVASLHGLKELQATCIANCRQEIAEGLACEEDLAWYQSLTNMLHSSLRGVQSSNEVDWQGFSDFYHELKPNDQKDVRSLITVFTSMPPETLLQPAHKSWLTPTRVNEFEGGREILGRLFVPQGSDRWVRADRLTQNLQVQFKIPDISWDEDGEVTGNKIQIVGMAATLAGAFDVAEKAISEVEVKIDSYMVRHTVGRPMPLEVQILPTPSAWTRQHATIITATVTPEKRGVGLEHAHAQWIAPYDEVECEAALKKIEILSRERTENSRADNYNSCSQITKEIERIKSRLPLEGYTSEHVMSTLRHTLQTLGAQRSLTSLLESDLGL